MKILMCRLCKNVHEPLFYNRQIDLAMRLRMKSVEPDRDQYSFVQIRVQGWEMHECLFCTYSHHLTIWELNLP